MGLRILPAHPGARSERPAGATTAEAELPTLEQWRTAQDTAAYLRASLPEASDIDPGDQPDDIGNDLVKSAETAVRNFARVGARLVEMRRVMEGKAAAAAPASGAADASLRFTPPFDLRLVADCQNEVLHRWWLVMKQAAGVVGGSVPAVPYTATAEAQRFVPFDSARQVTALRFVLDHTFRGVDELVQRQFASAAAPIDGLVSLLARDSLPNGWNLKRWHQKQTMMIDFLLDDARLDRVAQSATGVLPVVCTELDTLLWELQPAIERARQTPADVQWLLQIEGRLRRAVREESGTCRRSGWRPAP